MSWNFSSSLSSFPGDISRWCLQHCFLYVRGPQLASACSQWKKKPSWAKTISLYYTNRHCNSNKCLWSTLIVEGTFSLPLIHSKSSFWYGAIQDILSLSLLLKLMQQSKLGKSGPVFLWQPPRVTYNIRGDREKKKHHLHVAGLAGGAGPGADDGDPPDDDRGAFGDQTFILFVLWSGHIKEVGKRTKKLHGEGNKKSFTLKLIWKKKVHLITLCNKWQLTGQHYATLRAGVGFFQSRVLQCLNGISIQ